MLEEKGGWFVVNVAEARWFKSEAFGLRGNFEMEGSFPLMGVNLAVLEPGKPNCRYHRESSQEGFLVLSGECLLIVNDEERKLKAWDYVHCPPGATHVFVGAGDGPCVLLMMGNRSKDNQLFYPVNEKARAHNASAPEDTPEPRVAYSDVKRFAPSDPPKWPL